MPSLREPPLDNQAVRGADLVTLALDASTYRGTVAVLRDGSVVGAREAVMRGEMEERLMPAVVTTLRDANCTIQDVAHIICGAGPGSFTSLRIAASIAKGIALGNSATARETPLFAVSSLSLIVSAHVQTLAAGRYLALLDALRGECYAALLEVAADGRVTELARPTGGRIVNEEVAEVCVELRARAIGPQAVLERSPHARGVGPLLAAVLGAGPVPLDSWEPDYGRLAEAQRRWEAEHGRPLSSADG